MEAVTRRLITTVPTGKASATLIDNRDSESMNRRGTYLGMSQLEFTPLQTAAGEEIQTATGEPIMVEILTDWRK